MHTPEGPKQRAVYVKTRAEVAAKLRKAMADRDGGLVFDAGNLTLGEYLDRWLSDCVLPLVGAGKIEHSTYVRYAGIFRNHIKPTLGRRRLKGLNRAEVRSLYTLKAKELSPRSVDYLHVTLQKALKQAVRDDLIPRNVAEGERPRGSRESEEAKALFPEEAKALFPEEVRAFLEADRGERNHALYVVAVHTGLRQEGELLALKYLKARSTEILGFRTTRDNMASAGSHISTIVGIRHRAARITCAGAWRW